MNLRVLESTDVQDLLDTGGIKTIWQLDPNVPNSIADPATEKYVKHVLSTKKSLSLWKNDTIAAFVVGSVPKWDSDFFGYDSYIVRYAWGESEKALDRMLQELEGQFKGWNIRYSYVKLPIAAKPISRAFERIGFTLADARVTFNRKLGEEVSFPTDFGDLVFELAREEDIEPMAELCKQVSKIDRFHSDPNVPEEQADEVYYRWVINGGASGKESVKCLVNGELAGFHMSYPEDSIQSEDGMILSISDIMGVYPKFGGRGIGTGLFANYFSLAKLRGQRSVIAGVHLDNVVSLRLHEGVGFKAINTEIGFRKWY